MLQGTQCCHFSNTRNHTVEIPCQTPLLKHASWHSHFSYDNSDPPPQGSIIRSPTSPKCSASSAIEGQGLLRAHQWLPQQHALTSAASPLVRLLKERSWHILSHASTAISKWQTKANNETFQDNMGFKSWSPFPHLMLLLLPSYQAIATLPSDIYGLLEIYTKWCYYNWSKQGYRKACCGTQILDLDG